MRRLNSIGPILAERRWVRAGTDVTGFGLLGHLSTLCRSSQVAVEIEARAVPAMGRRVGELIRAGCVPGGTKKNLEAANEMTRWEAVSEDLRLLLADAQTSGGLLLCVPPRRLEAVLAELKRQRVECAAVIGRVKKSNRPQIQVRG
jgi:selenide,water dikinase